MGINDKGKEKKRHCLPKKTLIIRKATVLNPE